MAKELEQESEKPQSTEAQNQQPIFNHGFHGFHGLNLLAGHRIGQAGNLKGLFNRRLDSPLLALIFAKSLAFPQIFQN
jgi:hypothetical protein